jgi:hypothetical protein
LAAVDAATGVLLPWNHQANDWDYSDPPTNGVQSLDLVGSVLYAGGFFGGMDCQAHSAFAALDALANYTPAATFTPTATPTFTSSSTWTPTVNQTLTATPTPTLTSTALMTPTATPSLTPTPAESSPPFILWPNPSHGEAVTVNPGLTGLSDVRVQVFTTAYRKVQDQLFPQMAPGMILAIKPYDKWGTPLANGLYYLVLTSNKGRWIGKWLVTR